MLKKAIYLHLFMAINLYSGYFTAAELPLKNTYNVFAVPLIELNTDDKQISDDYSEGRFLLRNKTLDQGNFLTTDSVDILLDSSMKVRLRGVGSRKFAKKQFQVNFSDSKEKKKVGFLGMNPAQKWVFYGPYVDRTLFRNALAYKVGQELNQLRPSPFWMPDFRFVELVINGKYEGVYLAIEKIEQDKNRLALQKTHPKELKSGVSFILEVHGVGEEFRSKQGTYLSWRYPRLKDWQKWLNKEKWFEPAYSLKSEILGYLNRFESSLKSKNFSDPEIGYRSHVDITSFIDYMIIQEVFKNVDGYRRSAFFFKDKDGPITMGPLWDFNLAMGNMWFYGQHHERGWNFKHYKNIDGNKHAFWFRRMMKDTYFSYNFKKRYHHLRSQGMPLNKDFLFNMLSEFRMQLGSAIKRNEDRWKNSYENLVHRFIFNRPPWPNSHDKSLKLMKEWLHMRLKWIDQHINDLP